jgi:hypothetical protein
MKVKMARQMGRAKQWGFGNLFYFKEGCKDRISSKALKYIGLTFAGIFFVFTLFKNEEILINVQETSFSMKEYYVPSQLPSSVNKKSPKRTRIQKKFVYEPLVVTKRPSAKLSIPPGTYVKAKLVTGGSDGPVKAVLVESLRVGGQVVVPKGAVLVGTGSSTEDRLMIDLRKIIFQSGKVINASAIACDPSDQMPGILGSNVNSRALSLAGAIGLNFAAGFSADQNEDEQNPSIKERIQTGAVLAALEEGKRLSEQAKNTKPRIEIKRNHKFLILFIGN